MNSPSLRRQDASGHMPLGVFLDGALVAAVPREDTYGLATINRVAAERGLPGSLFEALLLCRNHPESSAVDCLECEPVGEEE